MYCCFLYNNLCLVNLRYFLEVEKYLNILFVNYFEGCGCGSVVWFIMLVAGGFIKWFLVFMLIKFIF